MRCELAPLVLLAVVRLGFRSRLLLTIRFVDQQAMVTAVATAALFVPLFCRFSAPFLARILLARLPNLLGAVAFLSMALRVEQVSDADATR